MWRVAIRFRISPSLWAVRPLTLSVAMRRSVGVQTPTSTPSKRWVGRLEEEVKYGGLVDPGCLTV